MSVDRPANPAFVGACRHHEPLPFVPEYLPASWWTKLWNIILYGRWYYLVCQRCDARAPLMKNSAFPMLTAYVCPCCAAYARPESRPSVWKEAQR